MVCKLARIFPQRFFTPRESPILRMDPADAQTLLYAHSVPQLDWKLPFAMGDAEFGKSDSIFEEGQQIAFLHWLSAHNSSTLPSGWPCDEAGLCANTHHHVCLDESLALSHEQEQKWPEQNLLSSPAIPRSRFQAAPRAGPAEPSHAATNNPDPTGSRSIRVSANGYACLDMLTETDEIQQMADNHWLLIQRSRHQGSACKTANRPGT